MLYGSLSTVYSWWFLRPQPPSSSPRNQVYNVRSSPSHSLDQNPSTQRGTFSDTTSSDSRLCTLPRLRLAALLHNSSSFILSAFFLPPLAIRGLSADFLCLQCLSLAPHFSHRPGSAAFLPHSFCRGGATYPFQSGVPEHLIKLHSDCHSDAFRAYQTLPLTTRSHVADFMAAGLFSHCDTS